MTGFLTRLKRKLLSPSFDQLDAEESYLELDTNISELRAKAVVRPFTVEEFEDIKPILGALREGKTIALVNIKNLRDKDMVELKRAVNKLKKTTDAIDGEIAGFGEDYLIITPSFATIYREQTKEVLEETAKQE